MRILRVLPHAQDGPPDHEVRLPPGKPYAALCLIALEPSGVTRDDLAAMLWSEAPGDRARHSVRQALTTIRGAIGPGALLEEGGRLRLAEGEITTDLAELEAALRAADVDAAFACWRGGPFAGFSLAEAPRFNDWADRIRSRYESRLGAALVAAATELGECGEHARALELLAHALDVRPYDEPSHVAFIRLLLRLGHLEEAEAAVDRARRAVDESTPGLLETVHAEVVSARRAAVAREDEPVRLTLEFVGRTQETATLRQLWKSALIGRPRTAAILGAAGIGKTRLAESLIRGMLPSEVSVVRLKAPDVDRSIDFASAADLVRELVGLPGAAGISSASHSILRRLLPSLGGAAVGEDMNGEILDTSLADGVLDLVEAVAHEAPLILFLDDLQWIDRRSRHLIFRVLRALRDIPVLAVVTCRSSDADQSATHALHSEAAGGRIDVLELGPLTREEVDETLRASLQVAPGASFDRVASSLFATSQGNPLFLVELLRLLIDHGIVTEERGTWCLDGTRLDGEWPLPSSVRQILTDRLVALSEDARRAAAFLARQRSGANVRRLGASAGIDDARLPEAVSELFSAGIVAWSDDERVDFVHDSLRDAARRVGSPGRPTGSRLWARRALAAAAVAGLATAIAVAVDASAGAPTAPYLGGGTIYVTSVPGEMRRFAPPDEPGGPWIERSPITVPASVGAFPAGAPDGRVRWFATMFREDRVPYPVELVPGEEPAPLSIHPGDTNLRSLHPGQRFAVLVVADESGPHYRLDVVLLDLLTGDERLIHPTPAWGGAHWTPDGRALTVMTRALTADTVHLMRADGIAIASQSVMGPNRDFVAKPCAPDGMRAIVARTSSSGPSLELLDMRSGALTPLPTIGPVGVNAWCSPDASGVASTQLVDGSLRLVVTEITGGRTNIGPAVSAGAISAWIPSSPSPFPTGVRAEPDSVTMSWGESRSLVANFLGPETEGFEVDEIEWGSEDPRIAYVSADGRVSAMGEGRTRIVASAFGLLYDTVVVRVETGTPSDALFVDRFDGFDEEKWAIIGSLTPTPVRVDGRLVLDASGGGVGTNGFVSRDGFDLSRGGTLELAYRLPLTRIDRQSVQLCLVARSAGDGSPIRGDGLVFDEGRVCFFHPIHQLNLFDPSAYALDGRVRLTSYRDPSLFPSDDWRHITLILAPDGAARLLVEHREVASVPGVTVNGPELRWYVYIYTRAVDTQFVMRDLVLWEGMRDIGTSLDEEPR